MIGVAERAQLSLQEERLPASTASSRSVVVSAIYGAILSRKAATWPDDVLHGEGRLPIELLQHNVLLRKRFRQS